MIDEQPIEQYFVAILQAGEADVLLERRRFGADLTEGRLCLRRERCNAIGYHTANAKLVACRAVERRALVVDGLSSSHTPVLRVLMTLTSARSSRESSTVVSNRITSTLAARADTRTRATLREVIADTPRGNR